MIQKFSIPETSPTKLMTKLSQGILYAKFIGHPEIGRRELMNEVASLSFVALDCNREPKGC